MFYEATFAGSISEQGVQLDEMDIDILGIVGSDRLLLRTLLELGNRTVPILPISSKGQPDFLFDVTVSSFPTIIEDLLDKKWARDPRTRLTATVSGESSPPILNDIGLFAKRSATLIRYELYLDGEPFWSDGSDGLLVATPTGSTAYSMSVGGPVVLNTATVFAIVPVNSINPSRHPLIVPEETQVEIRHLSKSVPTEIVLDGQIRTRVDGSPVVIRKSDDDVIFVKFDEEKVAALRGKLMKKAEITEDLIHDLPPSAKLVLKMLEYQGQLTQMQIIEETMLPPRTVRYALSLLLSEGLIKKRVSLRDSRQALYAMTDIMPENEDEKDAK